MPRIPSVDPNLRQGPIRRSATKFALSRPGTWFYSKVAARVDPVLMRLSGGRLNMILLLPVVVLTARGAKSGRPRSVPLVYFTDGDDVILIASSFGRAKHPAWYHNLKANPEAELSARGRTGRYRAQEVDGAERDRLYELATRVYRGYDVYEDRAARADRRIPVLRLSPLAD